MSDGLLKRLALAFAIALVGYFVAYTGIEHRRVVRGPWQVTFTNDLASAPTLVVNQPRLGITNVLIVFPDEPALPANAISTLTFGRAREVPYAVPLGRCIFLDTTFLPGTVVFEIFGHEIQLIPRVLTIDKREQPWRSDATVTVARSTNAISAAAGQIDKR
jgi:hypothetical protein